MSIIVFEKSSIKKVLELGQDWNENLLNKNLSRLGLFSEERSKEDL
jgi:hypothetical protein